MKTNTQKELEQLLKEYRSIQLDLESRVSDGQVEHDAKRLAKNNDRLEILVTGHGTGK